jgi:hypothetical protein
MEIRAADRREAGPEARRIPIPGTLNDFQASGRSKRKPIVTETSMSLSPFLMPLCRRVRVLAVVCACLLVSGCAGYSYGVGVGSPGYYGYRPAPYFYGSPYWYSSPYWNAWGFGYAPYYRHWRYHPYWGHGPYYRGPRPYGPRRWR